MSDPIAVRPQYTVAFCTKTNRLIEIIPAGASAADIIARLAPQYGDDLVELPPAEAQTRYEAIFKTSPQHITRDRFDEMLNILPPVNWQTTSDGESFKICERLAGRITAIYVRFGDKYATFNDDIRTPHHECCRRAFDFFTAAESKT